MSDPHTHIHYFHYYISWQVIYDKNSGLTIEEKTSETTTKNKLRQIKKVSFFFFILNYFKVSDETGYFFFKDFNLFFSISFIVNFFIVEKKSNAITLLRCLFVRVFFF